MPKLATNCKQSLCNHVESCFSLECKWNHILLQLFWICFCFDYWVDVARCVLLLPGNRCWNLRVLFQQITHSFLGSGMYIYVYIIYILVRSVVSMVMKYCIASRQYEANADSLKNMSISGKHMHSCQ